MRVLRLEDSKIALRRGYLICSAMEQELRWDTDNFLAESSYQVLCSTVLHCTVLYYQEGNLTNLSLLHPLNILIGLMCRVLL